MKLSGFLLIILFSTQAYAQKADFDHIDFHKADSIALGYKNEDLDNLPELAHKLTTNLDTDVERFRAIYMWVCTNINNDYGLYAKNKRKREKLKTDTVKLQAWNQTVTKTVLIKLLKNKKTICTGYAYLLKTLSNLANLECEMIHGYGRTSTTKMADLETPNHSWNATKIEGKWYLSDPTWASGLENPVSKLKKLDYIEGFFLADPRLFAVNHYPVEKQWWLLKERFPSFETFKNGPILYGKAYRNLSLHLAPIKLHNLVNKYETINFKYELDLSLNAQDLRFEIDDGYERKTVTPRLTLNDGQLVGLEYQFRFGGFYDLHVFAANDLIATYTFKVSD
ncbi:MAG: transglutaminase domain-containing protein [Psychroserpens sp.]|uniref:transglutaminase domain-containing protein n=1 Tax=Psychroserpens sp. TaxID=2020870 RepID=UPI003C8ACCF6